MVVLASHGSSLRARIVREDALLALSGGIAEHPKGSAHIHSVLRVGQPASDRHAGLESVAASIRLRRSSTIAAIVYAGIANSDTLSIPRLRSCGIYRPRFSWKASSTLPRRSQRGGTPEHQVGGQFVFVAFMRGRIAFDLVQESLEGNLGQFLLRHLNRRQGRNCEFGNADVVEPDYRKIIGYLDVQIIGLPHDSDRGHVIGAQHCGGARVKRLSSIMARIPPSRR